MIGAFYQLDMLGEGAAVDIALVVLANAIFQACFMALTIHELRWTPIPEQKCVGSTHSEEAAAEDVLAKSLLTKIKDEMTYRYGQHFFWPSDPDVHQLHQLLERKGELKISTLAERANTSRPHVGSMAALETALEKEKERKAQGTEAPEDGSSARSKSCFTRLSGCPYEATTDDDVESDCGGAEKMVATVDVAKWLAKAETVPAFVDRVIYSLVDREWMRLALLGCAVVTIVGSCMVMKHDGMDMSFEFQWLPPKSAARARVVVNSTIAALFGGWSLYFIVGRIFESLAANRYGEWQHLMYGLDPARVVSTLLSMHDIMLVKPAHAPCLSGASCACK